MACYFAVVDELRAKLPKLVGDVGGYINHSDDLESRHYSRFVDSRTVPNLSFEERAKSSVIEGIVIRSGPADKTRLVKF